VYKRKTGHKFQDPRRPIRHSACQIVFVNWTTWRQNWKITI